MDAKVQELINNQINKELYSAYLYMTFADFYEDAGLEGYANFYMIQAQEERDHALIFRKYLLENDVCPKMLAIDEPDKVFAAGDYIGPLKAAYEHEQYVTSLINSIYAAAAEVNDYRTIQFLKWFIDEQMEEEDTARDMITKMELFGGDARSLYELNQQYATRVYTVAAPLATA